MDEEDQELDRDTIGKQVLFSQYGRQPRPIKN